MKKVWASTAIVALAWVGAAHAQGGLYLEGEFGSGVAGNSRIHGIETFGGAGGPTVIPFSDRVGLKPGYFGGGLAGYTFWRGLLSVEGEGVYTNNLSKLVGPADPLVTNRYRLQTYGGFGNLKLGVPIPRGYGRFSLAPYVAGGAGYGNSRYSADGGHVNDSGFMWQGKVGVDIHTGTPWSVDVGYRYIETPKLRDDDGAGDAVSIKTGVQVASLGLRYAFGGSPPPPPPPPPPAPPPPPPPPPPTAPPPPPAPTVQQFVVYFPFDASDLTGDAQAIVKQAADAAAQGSGASIAVVGHTDASGSAAYNQRLSARRAKAVADALIGLGVTRTRLRVSWVGKSDLAVPTPDGTKEPLNRRATIDVRPSGDSASDQ